MQKKIKKQNSHNEAMFDLKQCKYTHKDKNRWEF